MNLMFKKFTKMLILLIVKILLCFWGIYTPKQKILINIYQKFTQNLKL